GDDLGEEYLRLLTVQEGWSKTLDRFHIDTVVLSPKFALAQTLKISRDWNLVYDDHVSLVFRRKALETGSLAADVGSSGRDREVTKTSNGDPKITQPKS